jgi:uncharacterized lipoprotein
MNLKSKRAAALAAGAVIMFGLAGCSSGPPEPTADQKKTSEESYLKEHPELKGKLPPSTSK